MCTPAPPGRRGSPAPLALAHRDWWARQRPRCLPSLWYPDCGEGGFVARPQVPSQVQIHSRSSPASPLQMWLRARGAGGTSPRGRPGRGLRLRARTGLCPGTQQAGAEAEKPAALPKSQDGPKEVGRGSEADPAHHGSAGGGRARSGASAPRGPIPVSAPLAREAGDDFPACRRRKARRCQPHGRGFLLSLRRTSARQTLALWAPSSVTVAPRPADPSFPSTVSSPAPSL